MSSNDDVDQTDLKSKRSRPDPVLPPGHRRLQILSLDPAADSRLETAHISRTVIRIPWEGHLHQGTEDAFAGQPVPPLLPGPCGEYIEVIDVDPASNCVYDPVDLNDPLLLARDGHAPSLGNPQFHQQMVYAVAMKTIANFERVLGRTVLWSDRIKDEQGLFVPPNQRFVRQLRIYPHALREENAYYSPVKKALLFGYFNATTSDPRDELPGGVVFTCLSHDIVAHETTHAIIDGMHRRLMDASNRDMLAFHEAFADIVAIFQHFTLPGLLLDQIKRNHGDLRLNNRLAQLACQFAQATGHGNALRNAIGTIDAQGRQVAPDPGDIKLTNEPHQRGAILVAAVFDAFLAMYEYSVRDLYRIATGGTGVLPTGDIHPDLAERLAETASNMAQRVLDICIRTLDYLPPVDVNFGDFLRALITADFDFHPEDPRRYRLAFIDAFRSRGIVPRDIRALGEDSLRWNFVDLTSWSDVQFKILPPAEDLRAMANAYDSPDQLAELCRHWLQEHHPAPGINQDTLHKMADDLTTAGSDESASPKGMPKSNRETRHQAERLFAQFVWFWLTNQAQRTFQLSPPEYDRCKEYLARQFGLDLDGLTELEGSPDYAPLEVHAVRPAVRRRADGRTKVELLVMLTQSRIVKVPADDASPGVEENSLEFRYRGGCTLLIDPDANCITYAISKCLPGSDEIEKRQSPRLERQIAYYRRQLVEDRQLAVNRFKLSLDARQRHYSAEPFAVVHRHDPDPAGY